MTVLFSLWCYSCIHQIKSVQCHCVGLAELLLFPMMSFEKGLDLNF